MCSEERPFLRMLKQPYSGLELNVPMVFSGLGGPASISSKGAQMKRGTEEPDMMTLWVA